jgi:alanyl-tRNA synthetase
MPTGCASTSLIPRPVSEAELSKIEDTVNEQILANSPVNKEVMPIAEAQEKGALALFGEKYGEQVRVVTMGGQILRGILWRLPCQSNR